MQRLTISGVLFVFGMVLTLRPIGLFGQEPPPTDSPLDRALATKTDFQLARAMVMITGNILGANGSAEEADSAMNMLIRSWLTLDGEPELSEGIAVSFRHLATTPEGNTLGVLIAQGRGDAEKELASVQKPLERALQEIQNRMKREPLMRQMEAASERQEIARHRVADLGDYLRTRLSIARENQIALEPDDPQLLASLRRDQLALGAELAGLKAQHEAINEQILMATDRLQAGSALEDPVREELEMVLKLREKELSRIAELSQSGMVSQSEVAQAELGLVKARAELAEFRQMQAQRTESGPLGRLNERLVDTEIALRTTEARLETTAKAIHDQEQTSYNPAHPLLMEIQQGRRELEAAWAEQEAAAAEEARLRAALDAIVPPRVIMLGREGDAR